MKLQRREGYVLLAVNGTLMRGLAFESDMIDAGATFVSEAKTEKMYRLWSINDAHPAMIKVSRDDSASSTIDVEVWEVPAAGLAEILMKEPTGLSVGKVKLDGGETVLGVIGEPEFVVGQKEITDFGGWRKYIKSL